MSRSSISYPLLKIFEETMEEIEMTDVCTFFVQYGKTEERSPRCGQLNEEIEEGEEMVELLTLGQWREGLKVVRDDPWKKIMYVTILTDGVGFAVFRGIVEGCTNFLIRTAYKKPNSQIAKKSRNSSTGKI